MRATGAPGKAPLPSGRISCRLSSCWAADVPAHLWARILAWTLQSLVAQDHSRWRRSEEEPFGFGTAVLRCAIHRASVCKLWRQAAVQMDEALELEYLHPSQGPATAKCCLSVLAGELVQGCPSISLLQPQLADPVLPGFLEAARHTVLSMYKHCKEPHVFVDLSGCTSLQRLECFGILPGAYPPCLRTLEVFLPHDVPPEVALRMPSLLSLASLAQLTLHHGRQGVHLSEKLSSLPALQSLRISVKCEPRTGRCSFSALQAIAACGVRVQVEINLSCSDELRTRSTHRRQLWAALAHVPLLHRPEIRDARDWLQEWTVTNAERPALAAVRCRELLMEANMMGNPYALQLLQDIGCDAAHCVLHYSAQLEWSQLSLRPGIFVFTPSLRLLDTAVITCSGCTGVPPDSAEPWVLQA